MPGHKHPDLGRGPFPWLSCTSRQSQGTRHSALPLSQPRNSGFDAAFLGSRQRAVRDRISLGRNSLFHRDRLRDALLLDIPSPDLLVPARRLVFGRPAVFARLPGADLRHGPDLRSRLAVLAVPVVLGSQCTRQKITPVRTHPLLVMSLFSFDFPSWCRPNQNAATPDHYMQLG